MDLTLRDVSRLLEVSEETVVRWVRSGKLPAHRFDEELHFNRVELQEAARAMGRPLPAELFGAEALPSLADALERGGIHRDVSGATPAEVFKHLVQLGGIPKSVDRGLLEQLLAARESLASTGVGHGIAIPHPRDPLVLVDTPTALLCFLKKPVDFAAPDGKPVRIVFALLSPTVKAHLQVLSRLSFALHDREFRKLLDAQAPEDRLLGALRAIETGAKAKEGRR